MPGINLSIIIGDLEATFFELSRNLVVGLEKFLIGLALEEDYVFTLFDRIIEEYVLSPVVEK